MMRGVVVVAVAVLGACDAEQRAVKPQGSEDAAPSIDADPTRPDAAIGSGACDLTGTWVVVQISLAEALGAEQTTSTWFYHDIVDDGDGFTIVGGLSCGLRVTGTTTVTLEDDTLEALALRTSFTNIGRRGIFRPNPQGTACELSLERTYILRGANMAQFLTSTWNVGDPPVELSAFPPLPPDAAAGMEDWDVDGMEGITLVSGFGGRYVAQRDWNEYAGTVPLGATEFGGAGVVDVTWDGQEAVSEETSPILRTTATPINPGGRAWFWRVEDELEIVTDGPNPELETCKNVQRLALERFPDP
jgi:hypothetical protein